MATSARFLVVALFSLGACQQSDATAPHRDASGKLSRGPVPAQQTAEPGTRQTALFAGGCYWGIEAVFSHVRGVTSAVSGFHGGSGASARYDRVSRGTTSHAETVRVTYDPRVVRYDQLLQVFFAVGADPTQLNRQGPDVGPQYRSALIPLSAGQQKAATAYLSTLSASGRWKAPVVTRIEPHQKFYPAAADHQDFAEDNPGHPYIRHWDAPKIAALKRLFPELYKPGFTRG
ncbi:MAG: peptide-methionine (S)-S-oxide reductase MsrA [Pseudomonadota bacterium]